jgi:hypothetical protein
MSCAVGMRIEGITTANKPHKEVLGLEQNPGQEAQLSQIASHAGTDTERLVKDAALRLLDRTLVFAPLCGKASRRPTGRNSSKRKRWMRASSGCLTPDAYPADAGRGRGLAS